MEHEDEIPAEEEQESVEAQHNSAETPLNVADPSENTTGLQTDILNEEEAGEQMNTEHHPAMDSKSQSSRGNSPGSERQSSNQDSTHGQPTSTLQNQPTYPAAPDEQSHYPPALGDQSHPVATHELPPTEHQLEPSPEHSRGASVDQEPTDHEPETHLSIEGENLEPEVWAEDVQDEDEEEQEFPPEDRGPPMAPPPAILGLRDDLLEGAQLGNEFLEDNMLRLEFNLPARVKGEEKAAQPKSPRRIKKILPTYPFRAKMRSDAEIEAALRQGPPRHEYCGFLFSSVTPRPTGGYTNYFLPVYPQPQPKQHIQISGVKIPKEKIGSIRDTAKGVLPLSTIKVIWPSRRTSTIYNLENIYAYLSRFGPIDGVYPKSVNSAFVVFSDLEAARAVLTCSHLGRPWDQLITFWVEPRMYNTGFYYKYALMESLPTRYRI